ncbi:MAG TPA: chemotaxis protein CheB [Candidatus Limnocylindria bacterium]|nr:chemotaxis protein CheB [Candidatus Limnocylindria bacterium]
MAATALRVQIYTIPLSRGTSGNELRPAVDILFDSAIKGNVNRNSIGVHLTGMGSDGAPGTETSPGPRPDHDRPK